MLVKVCGMTDPGNIAAVAALNPDMMGFIFYGPSPRCAGKLAPEALDVLPGSLVRVGVFVDEEPDVLRSTVERYNITVLQLHGTESPEFCRNLREDGFRIIKAVRVGAARDVAEAELYDGCCDLLLFDTMSEAYGGTGKAFDWDLLQYYQGKLPFLLGGGISVADTRKLRDLQYSNFKGVDLNSRFEDSPGVKSDSLLKTFLDDLRR